MKLNLKTKNTSQEMIKTYLEENVSEALAEKINDGVRIEKDGKTLISKKDLDDFWAYATKEAQKLKEQYVDNDTVYGWAMHFFEEGEIEGKLYNEDGTEYRPAPKIAPISAKTSTPYTPPPPKPKPQMSIFDDLLKAPVTENAAPMPKADAEETDDEAHDDYIEEMEAPQPTHQPEPVKKPKSIYQQYQEIQKKYPDCIVMLRLGDFYEVFGDGAVTLAKEYDITLTSRDCGLPERVPMLGIPYHAMDAYVAKFIEKHRIAIVEDMTTWDVELRDSNMTVNGNTGEILSIADGDEQNEYEDFDRSAFDVEALAVLDEIFGEEITLR